MLGGDASAQAVANTAAQLARLPDEAAPKVFSKGLRATHRYRVPGAREEAQQAFPHVMQRALPQLRLSRLNGSSETHAGLDALMAIMTSLTDTCVLSRAGMEGLDAMQDGARAVLNAGGSATPAGQQALAVRSSDAGAQRLAGRGCRPACRHAVSRPRRNAKFKALRGCYGKITLTVPASRALSGRALAGVVGSGDMEVLFTAEPGQTLTIDITTSVDNSRGRWEALFNRLQTVSSLPAGKLIIHDFGATPGVARIRIEQVFEG